MSFAKAKLRRFNDIQNDSPPPNAYNPNTSYKVKGYAAQKSKRFLDDKIYSKPVPVNIKPKQMPRRKLKPITQTATITKGHKNQPATRTVRPNFETNHVYVLESEIENLKNKISTFMPSMNNKVYDLKEIWKEKKKSILVDDTERGQLIDDNLNNILKEISQLLSKSQQEHFQEIAFIQSMTS